MACKDEILSSEECSYVIKQCIQSDQFTINAYGGEQLLTNCSELTVMEDLSQQGFFIPDIFDIDSLKLTLKTLAKYHTRSLAIEERKSKELGKPYKLSEELLNLQNGKIFQTSWLKPKLETLYALIDLLPRDKIKSGELKKGLANIAEDFSKETKAKNIFRSVLCHGYLWGNNVKFKGSYNRIPTQCRLINFEYQHYSPPALDVLQLIYMRTSRKFRQHHLHDLLQFYYECLKNELQAENLNANQVIPQHEDFEVSVQYFLPIVKLQAACFQQCWQIVKTNNASENATSLLIEMFNTQTSFRNIISQSIIELWDLVIHPGLTVEDCFKIIKNKVGRTDYELLNYELVPLGQVSGFLGDHNKLKIEILINDEKKTLHLFAKHMPKNSAAKSFVVDADGFYKEIFFYRDFIPMIQGFGVDIINDCGIPCYFTRHDELVIFDDFEILDYRTLNPREPFSFEVMTLVVKKMAKLHASSIILEEKLNEKSKSRCTLEERFAKELKEGFFTQEKNHNAAECYRSAVKGVQRELELFPDPNLPISEEEMKLKTKKAFELFYELVKPSKEFRNVVCHGDLWASNILVKFIKGKPTDCRLIDYQLSRYCPPAHDLLSFIYLTTNRSVRKQHFTELIDLYYNEFAENLNKYQYKIEEIYPYDDFIKSVEYMTPQAVCQTSLYYQMINVTSDIVKEYMVDEKSWENIFLGKERKNFIAYVAGKDPIYAERLRESIEDLREMCIKYF